ncbi:MAG: hypothetical protein AB1816_20145 [Bacillota bacterium]
MALPWPVRVRAVGRVEQGVSPLLTGVPPRQGLPPVEEQAPVGLGAGVAATGSGWWRRV